jgi:hypothetical protein
MLLMAMIYFGAGRGCGVDREGGYDVKLRTEDFITKFVTWLRVI